MNICIYIYMYVHLYIYVNIYTENRLCVYYHIGVDSAPFFIHSTPPFKTHPTAMERMLFDFLSMVSKLSLLFRKRL